MVSKYWYFIVSVLEMTLSYISIIRTAPRFENVINRIEALLTDADLSAGILSWLHWWHHPEKRKRLFPCKQFVQGLCYSWQKVIYNCFLIQVEFSIINKTISDCYSVPVVHWLMMQKSDIPPPTMPVASEGCVRPPKPKKQHISLKLHTILPLLGSNKSGNISKCIIYMSTYWLFIYG